MCVQRRTVCRGYAVTINQLHQTEHPPEHSAAATQTEAVISGAASDAATGASGDLHERVAEFLHSIGWRSLCDAQWHGLRDALPELADMLKDVKS